MNTSVTKKSLKKRVRRSKTSELAQPVEIPVIRVTNPFNPREFVRETVLWGAKKTLQDYFPIVADLVVVSVNGKIVESDKFAVTYLDRTDNLVVCPVPAGSNGAKQIVAIIAIIALGVMTGGAGFAAFAGDMGVSVGLAQGIVMVAGSMLIQGILAPSKPTNSSTSSTTYGIDGAKLTSVEGAPVPVSYGKFRTAGNVIDMFVVNDGDTQDLYMLINAGEGPIAGITDIQINNNPITDYKQVQTDIRLGNQNQTPIPWFSGVTTSHSLGLETSQDYIHYTTQAIVDAFRLDFTAPYGLSRTDLNDGSTSEQTVVLNMDYRLVGASSWTPVPIGSHIIGQRHCTATLTNAPGPDQVIQTGQDGQIYVQDAVTGAFSLLTPTYVWTYDDTGLTITDQTELTYLSANALVTSFSNDGGGSSVLTGTVPLYGNTPDMTANMRSAVRRSYQTGPLEKGKYDIRVSRANAKSTDASVMDTVYLTDVNEIVNDTLSYPNTALLGLRIVLDDTISGVPNVTFMNGGRIINAYGLPGSWATIENWYPSASSNPAWILWDMLTNKRYGAGVNSARLDFSAFKTWAVYCDDEGLTWHGPFDTVSNVWDAAQLVLRVGHAQMVNIGTKYSIITEAPATPVMMFSVANMIENTYKETWLGTADRANSIDVTYFDKTDSYKQKTVKVYDPAVLVNGTPTRNSAITMYGVDNAETAFKEAQFMMNLNRYILKTVSFSAPLEAISCTVGSLIYVQHDMPNWAQAGRFNDDNTASVVQLDRPVTMEAGKQYMLLALHDTQQQAAGAIYNIAGDSIFLTGYNGMKTVKRLKVGTIDVRASATFDQGGGSYGVIVDDPAGLVVGAAYTLWDTDVVEEVNVVNVPGDTSVITLQTPMIQTAALYGNWMFGEVGKVKQAFRVTSIIGSHEYRRDITALQYDPLVYDFGRYGTTTPPVIHPEDSIIGPVMDLVMYEETYVSGSNIVSKAVASWALPQTGMYDGADIYVKKNDGPQIKIGSVPHRTDTAIDTAKGDVLTVTVVAYDAFGKRCALAISPSITYTVIGELPKVNVGSVTGAEFIWSGKNCKISWRYNSLTHSYEFGSEPVGADAGALDPQFKDYEIKIFDKAGVTLRRTEYVTASNYTYSYEHNFEDGIERHLQFQIRMRDKSNNLGPITTLDAYNPPPIVLGTDSTATYNSAAISYAHSEDPDFAGATIWLSQNANDLSDAGIATYGDTFVVFDGPDKAITLSKLMFNADYYYRIAAYDAFGKTELLPSAVTHFKTPYMDVDAIAGGVLKDSQLITTLQDRINLVDGPVGLLGSVAARVLAEATERGTAITNLANSVNTTTDAISSTLSSVSAVTNNNTAVISTEITARTTADSALSARIDAVAASTDTNTAAIVTETTARTTADSALATTISALMATVDDNTASIATETTVRANADSASAAAISTISSTVADHTTAIGVQATSINGLAAQYTVKIDNNGYVSGYGLASTTINGVPVSEFMVRADSFSVVMPGYPNVYPFTIGAVGGTPAVIISTALIGDASIATAKIGDAQINTLKIAGNAVTVPSYVSGAYSASGLVAGSLVQIASLTLSFNDAVNVLTVANWQASQTGSGFTGGNTRFMVKVDGNTYLDWADTAYGGVTQSHIASAKVFLGAGTHTFTMWVGNNWTDGTWDLAAWGVTFLGVMR